MHKGVNAALKIAVTRQHTGADNVTFFHGIGDFRQQWSGIADAGRAAVAHGVETHGIKVIDETGFLQVVRHDA